MNPHPGLHPATRLPLLFFLRNLLLLHKGMVDATLLQQLVMRALFYNLGAFIIEARCKHEDAIGILDRGKAMCDDNRSATLAGFFESVLNQLFTACI